MSVKNIIITNVNQQTTAEYIADVLWKQKICKVSSISLVHEIRNDNVSLIAYVEIDRFCETEAAYEFVYNLTADCSVFCHDKDDLENMDKHWFLKNDPNKYGKSCATRYNTTTFTPEFFTHNIVEPADEKDLTPPGEVAMNIG